jgi:crotonobetainyl-CoA:carnitine CoA-transferase CaiB-like acyl-CoA transferase
MLEHPQTIAREMVVETEHARAGRVKSLGLPIKFSDTPGAITRPAPLLGEHSYEVLFEIGYTSFEIDKLIEDGVVVTT